ncbi:Phosphodiest-domain-containing protein [Phlebopus sp. FC_14]|nr:Phosphodiest-domain-containing protein [Phlebopus sp. FC_14]
MPVADTNNVQVCDDDERRGLLSNVDGDVEDQAPTPPNTSPSKCQLQRKWKLASLAVVVLFVLGGALYAGLRRAPFPSRPDNGRDGGRNTLFSNGTHQFKRTVILISIDGLRADYLDRGLTPHLLDISKQGIRAKYMKPIFPTLTFPNHWTLMTGLYAESHGIVANNFWDPVSDTEFMYNRVESAWNASWWWGEPMWETAGHAGVKTANLMWPGPPTTLTDASPTYFVPWRDKVPMQEKLDQILEWLDIDDVEQRPQMILAYEPSLDQAGHATGPMSALVNQTLLEVDIFARNLHTALIQRNLSSIADVIFVSDHGMGDTSHVEWIYVDDESILGSGADSTDPTWSSVTHYDGWPSMGLRFHSEVDQHLVLEKLVRAAQDERYVGKFDVYVTDTYEGGGYVTESIRMPSRYHFSSSERIAPIWIVPRIGYALTTKEMGEDGMSIGNHGYDNEEPSMGAIFVAHGPFSTGAKALSHRSTESNLAGEHWHSITDNAYVMPGFPNVEIYNLIMRLLDIEDWAARTNGTSGFWDAYVDDS